MKECGCCGRPTPENMLFLGSCPDCWVGMRNPDLIAGLFWGIARVVEYAA